jgi:hypothetical protein
MTSRLLTSTGAWLMVGLVEIALLGSTTGGSRDTLVGLVLSVQRVSPHR